MPTLNFKPEESPALTFDDVYLGTHNATHSRVIARFPEHAKELERLLESSDEAFEAAKADDSADLKQRALQAHKAYRSKLIELAEMDPEISRHFSRDDIDFTPIDGFGNTPVTISNITGAVGKRMAEAAARMGSHAAFPQDMTDAQLKSAVEHMQTRHPDYLTPIVVKPTDTVGEKGFKWFVNRRDIDHGVVVDDDGVLLGIVSADKITDANESMPVESIMETSDIVTAKEGITPLEAIKKLNEQRIDFLPILDSDRKVVGVMTKEHAAFRLRYEPHLNPEGGLATLATVGALSHNTIARSRMLIDLSVQGIMLDTAHADQGIQIYRNVEKIRKMIEESRKQITLICGNVTDPEAVKNLIAAGVDIVKVGIGPARVCRTREIAGVGTPQLTAILKSAEVADVYGKHVWGDGGIGLIPGNAAKALAAGASQIVKSVKAVYENHRGLKGEQDKKYVTISGMASSSAANFRNAVKENNDQPNVNAIVRDILGPRNEGQNNRRYEQVPGLESTARVLHFYVDGITSSASYAGARDMHEFRNTASFGLQTTSGNAEANKK